MANRDDSNAMALAVRVATRAQECRMIAACCGRWSRAADVAIGLVVPNAGLQLWLGNLAIGATLMASSLILAFWERTLELRERRWLAEKMARQLDMLGIESREVVSLARQGFNAAHKFARVEAKLVDVEREAFHLLESGHHHERAKAAAIMRLQSLDS